MSRIKNKNGVDFPEENIEHFGEFKDNKVECFLKEYEALCKKYQLQLAFTVGEYQHEYFNTE